MGEPDIASIEADVASIEARVGARWWADKIRDGFFPDNGAEPGDATKSPMALGLIASLQKKEMEQMTPEKIDVIERRLAVRIQEQIDHAPGFGFGVDYHPDPVLAKALEEAGIKAGMTILPWKTVMWARSGCVKVGDGYRAAPMELPLEEPR